MFSEVVRQVTPRLGDASPVLARFDLPPDPVGSSPARPVDVRVAAVWWAVVKGGGVRRPLVVRVKETHVLSSRCRSGGGWGVRNK